MPNILDEYLIKLGTTVDQAGLRRFDQALMHARTIVDSNMKSIAGTVFKTQVEVVAGFAAMGGAALGLVDKVAMADQEYRLFALHMFMSKDAARSLKVAMDALGQPMENLWWDSELRGRTHQHIEDQRRMAPTGDYDAQMHKIRDVRFEFTRLRVEMEYLGMNTVMEFMHALGTGPDELLRKLRITSEWLIVNMPQISKVLAKDFLPIWRDIKDVMWATGDAIANAALLFTNLVGLISGDDSIEGMAFSFDKLTTALQHTSHGMAGFAELVAHVELLLSGLLNAVSLASEGHFKEAGQVAKAALDELTTKQYMELMTGAFGFAFGGPLGGAAGFGAGYEAGSALEGTLGKPSPSMSYAEKLVDKLRNGAFTDNGLPIAFGSSLVRSALHNDAFNDLLKSMIHAESGGNPSIVSPKGAVGLMQLMPGTAKSLGVTNSLNPVQNILGGAKDILQLLARYHGNEAYALAAYNAGTERFDKFLAGKATLPKETRNYVAKILAEAGQRGTVQVGSITVNVVEPRATPHQIHQATVSAIRDAMAKQSQLNQAEFSALAWGF